MLPGHSPKGVGLLDVTVERPVGSQQGDDRQDLAGQPRRRSSDRAARPGPGQRRPQQGYFDTQFHPLKHGTRQRWVGIMMARRSGLSLPPVKLIRVGDAYFVRDGHHRVSVARALAEEYIEAEVTVLTLAEQPVPIQQPCLAPTT